MVLAVPFTQMARAETITSDTEDMLQAFLSETIGIDLYEYKIANKEYSFTYPSEYGGTIKQEHVHLDFTSSEGNFSVMGLFLNGFNGGIFIYPPTNGSMIYKQQPLTNAWDESNRVLKNYKNFAETHQLKTSHIDSAIILLNNSTTSLSPSESLHTFNNVTGFVPSTTTKGNIKQQTKQESVKWTYNENGVDMPNKCLKIDFGSGKLHFVDTWNLFTVASFSVISENEVNQIAHDAANKYNLTLIGENDTLIVPEKPEWSNRTTIVMNMIPGEIYNDEVNKANPVVSAGNATRDPMALYPLWETVCYFSKNIGNVYGIAVGVWGDTKEIAYITPYGYLGTSEENSIANTEVISDEPEQTDNSVPEFEDTKIDGTIPSSGIYFIVAVASISAIGIALTIVFKKRRK